MFSTEDDGVAGLAWMPLQFASEQMQTVDLYSSRLRSRSLPHRKVVDDILFIYSLG